MAEGKGTSTTSKQEKEPDKRSPWWKRLWARTGFGDKTVWDWLQLLGTLAIPVVVAVATAWFSFQQSTTQTQIEEQRAQDEALQAYFDQMSTLLLERDLRSSTEDNATQESKEARTLARARTLTVLGRLDPSRKTAVAQFLVEAELVQSVDERDPIISLAEADLSDSDLQLADLRGALLEDADLSGANLGEADLSGADLSGADLFSADLFSADLFSANLRGANLSNANLGEANLGGADLRDADLSYADLFSADLRWADLSGANLSEADLSGADLFSADLFSADLRGANLFSADGVTKEELEQQAKTLEGATMPDGSVHH